MEYAEYLRSLPKVELHCHVEGTPPEIAKQLVRIGVDATWLDPVDQAALRDRFEEEITSLDEALSAA